MGLKVAETTGNINNTFGPGTAKEHTVQWWFKRFRKGNKSLEDEECSDRIPKHGFLCSWKKQTFLVGKNMLVVIAPILITKDVFEPSYNDLKFTVQNCNCTNLTELCLNF